MDKILNKKWIPLVLALFVAIVAFWVLIVNNQRSFQGNLWGSFLPGKVFGIPEVSKNYLGMYPVAEGGWDGQFYYNISNDLLGVTDVPQHIDAPSYRYQRIAMPLLASVVANVLGYHHYTPPLIYHSVQIGLLFLAMYMLTRFLMRRNINPLYSLFWGLSINTVNTLIHGLPDSSSDSLFVIAIVMLLERRYWLYIIFSSLLLLSREGYAVFAAIIFLLSFFGKLEGVKRFSISSIRFAVPGILLVGWYAYVTVHFGHTPASQAFNMTDWFGRAWVLNTIKSLEIGNKKEFVLHITTLLFMVFITITAFLAARKNKIWYGVLAYILLLWHLGIGVTDLFTNYLKALVVFLAVFAMLIKDLGKWYKYILLVFSLLLVVPTTAIMFKTNVINATTWNYVLPDPDLQGAPSHAFTDFKSEIRVIGTVPPFVKPLWYAGKNDTALHVEVKNTSSEIWRNNIQGKDVVMLSYHWLDLQGKEVLADGIRTQLPKNIYPDESFESKMTIGYPKKPGKYILRISMVQEGVAWFYMADGGYLDIPATVVK